MGFLEKLWDDTVAGPSPDNGLGRLRKYSSFSSRSPVTTTPATPTTPKGSHGEDLTDGPRITRSITIPRSEEILVPDNGSLSPSPAGSTPPVSPFFGKKESRGLRRRLSSEAYEKAMVHIRTTEI